ncbi:MAG: class I SAM-dependent methyltransferase, partial [Candidatus Paceibacterota bacterium]
QWMLNIDIPMEETEYFKWLETQLITNGSVWNGLLNNREDVIRQYDRFKDLFRIAPNFDEHELISRVINSTAYYYGPICVKVRNDGSLTIWDGMHRISILSALSLPIQFTICERQDKWQNLMDDLKSLYPASLYQAIPHPDFEDWPYFNNDLKESQIADIVKSNGIKSVLDLGSCHGHILYSLRDLLESATGVEYNVVRYNILKLLCDRLGFESYNTNIFDAVSNANTQFDCVFALAVFHHFTKENRIGKFEELLDNIQAASDMLLYELPEQGEEQYEWMYPGVDIHTLIQNRYSDKTIISMQRRKLVLLRK